VYIATRALSSPNVFLTKSQCMRPTAVDLHAAFPTRYSEDDLPGELSRDLLYLGETVGCTRAEKDCQEPETVGKTEVIESA
jgi:hypothetical protein